MAYTSVAQVQIELNRTLTGAQAAQIDELLPVVEAWINTRTDRTWDTAAPITGEAYTIIGPLLWLKHTPVTTVDGVTVRRYLAGETLTTLVDGVTYELLNATTGLLAVSESYVGWLALVDYTPAVPLDSRVARAATLLAARWARSALDGISGDIKSYSIGQELSVTFREGGGSASNRGGAAAEASARDIPAEVLTLLDSAMGRRRGVFA